MNRRVGTLRARSSAIIGVVAVAVSLVVSAPFVSSAAGREPRGTEPAASAPTGPPATGQTETAAAPQWVGLVTGDQVSVDGSGRVAFRPGPGRGGIQLRLYSSGSHLYVVPADAAALVDRGVVDRRLFDVRLLARPEYRRANAEGLAVIVTYAGPAARQLVRSGQGVRVEHVYTSIDGDGLRVGSVDAWRRLSSATGIKRVWLDAVQNSL
jgi:hypothetical protein